MKKFLTLALLLVFAQTQTVAFAVAAGQATKGGQTPEEVKVQVNRAGLGEKARVTVRFKDGTKQKGYVAEHRENDFVLRDRKTGAPSIIAYDDVAKVESGYGHSAVRNLLLSAGIGVGGALLVWGLLIGTSDD